MGHAGAIISGGKGTAVEKMTAMKKAGIAVVESPADIGKTMLSSLEKLVKKTTVKKSAKPKSVKSKKTLKKKKKK